MFFKSILKNKLYHIIRLSFYCSFVKMNQINFANNYIEKQLEALLCCLTSEMVSFREKMSFEPPWNVNEFGLRFSVQ
jgi:hypothetical protein